MRKRGKAAAGCFVCGAVRPSPREKVPIPEDMADCICADCEQAVNREAGKGTDWVVLYNRDYAPAERVAELEALLERFVSYFDGATNRREAWGPLVQDAKDLLEKHAGQQERK